MEALLSALPLAPLSFAQLHHEANPVAHLGRLTVAKLKQVAERANFDPSWQGRGVRKADLVAELRRELVEHEAFVAQVVAEAPKCLERALRWDDSLCETEACEADTLAHIIGSSVQKKK